MTVGVCLITAGLKMPGDLGDLLKGCGFEVWTPDSPSAGDGHIYDEAICMVIDMPGEAGFRTLKLFRDYGVQTPALVIVDPGLEAAGGQGGRLEVVPRTADPLEIMRWIESVCITRRYESEQKTPERELLRA